MRRALPALLIAALLGLAACGSSNQLQPPAGAPSPTPTTSASSPAGPPAAGKLAFTATTLDGETFDAATLIGKPVLLWFWAPWCPTCVAEAPDVLDIQRRFAGRINILGVAGLDLRANMQPFVDLTRSGSITHLADPGGEVWRVFDVTQQSTYVLLDASGNVRFKGIVGGGALRDKVADVIG